MIRHVTLLTIILIITVGCSKPELHELQNTYTTPKVPIGLAEFHTAEPNTKLFESLPDDNKTISLHEYYRDRHRDGWNEAFDDWRLERKFKSDEECRQIAQIVVFLDGRVAGYNSAKTAIEQHVKNE